MVNNIENFDMKEFLLMQLNEGDYYFDILSDSKCGCIKGICFLSCKNERDYNSLFNFMFDIYTKYPRLGLALDIAEHILMKGFPQKAKLYFSCVMEKYNLIEDKNNNIVNYPFTPAEKIERIPKGHVITKYYTNVSGNPTLFYRNTPIVKLGAKANKTLVDKVQTRLYNKKATNKELVAV